MSEHPTGVVGIPRPPSRSLRFLGLLEQPDSDPLEFDEGDVVWSSSDLSSPDPHSPPSSPPPPDSRDRSYSPAGRRRRPFPSERIGLSAALAEGDGSPMVRRTVPVPSPGARAAEAPGGIAKCLYGSAPVTVPAWSRGRARAKDEEWGEGGGRRRRAEEDDDGEMIPPHVIVARSHLMRFSVFEGVGRTLKGRDLRRVRNAVFQKTGFLD